MPQARTLEQLSERYGGRYKWLVLLTAMIGTMASILSSTIVNVAVPDLSAHFQLGQAQAQWVSAGFMVAMTLSMLLTPWLLERYGLRRTYSGAVALLMAGGIAGGLAGNYDLVLAMRVVEGLAAGVLQPIPAIIILRAFEPHQQGRAMGIFGFGVVFAPAIGPAVGGFLVEQFGWRSIFFVVVPFCLSSLALAMRYLPAALPGRGGKPIDWRGLILAGTGVICLLNGLVQLQGQRVGPGFWLLFAGVLAIVGFILLELRLAAPLMNLRLFVRRQFGMGALVAFIYGMALFGSTYLLPVYMQLALMYGPARAGLVLLPAGLVLAVVIPVAGSLADRLPAHWLVSGGLGLLAASFALLATVVPGTPYLVLMLWAIVGRIGLGFVLPSLSLASMRGLAPAEIAQGSVSINFARQLGGAIGVSVTGILLEWRLAAHGASLAASDASVLGRIRAFDETLLALAVLCALAMGAAWRMHPDRRP